LQRIGPNRPPKELGRMIIKVLGGAGGVKFELAAFAALLLNFRMAIEVYFKALGDDAALGDDGDAFGGKLPDLIHQHGVMRAGE